MAVTYYLISRKAILLNDCNCVANTVKLVHMMVDVVSVKGYLPSQRHAVMTNVGIYA